MDVWCGVGQGYVQVLCGMGVVWYESGVYLSVSGCWSVSQRCGRRVWCGSRVCAGVQVLCGMSQGCA